MLAPVRSICTRRCSPAGSLLLRSLSAGPRHKHCITMSAAAKPEADYLCFQAAKRWQQESLAGLQDQAAKPVQISTVQQADAAGLLSQEGGLAQQLATLSKFTGKSGEVLVVPSTEGNGISRVLLGVSGPKDLWAYAALPGRLPPGVFQVSGAGSDADAVLLGWALGTYKFGRYKTNKAAGAEGQGATDKPRLLPPEEPASSMAAALAEAFFWARDLINTPAEDMGPQHLEAEAAALAAAHPCATFSSITGDELLAANYPAVHTVGRASSRPPVLIDLAWAPPGAQADQLPLLALVGKGVCFDTGGYNIKTAAGMKNMKKDMGGAALMLALAHVIMSAGLPVRLRVLVPAVENCIAGNAYKPLDVLRTRAGITVEQGNCDAEGRLILCDCLAEAAAHQPDLLLDAATLTGAARAALGPEVPAVFSSDDAVWDALYRAGQDQVDPLWRMPLYAGYKRMLDSKVADISSTGSELGQAGAVTAALFLQEFVKEVPRWLHVDTGAWVSGGACGAGRPEGGEALALRALWSFIQQRYSSTDTRAP